ncbi:hypothetical protein E4U43_003134 [Claviceps pusilla]|uniref:Histone-lysine N-methyltransferase n=1 Tax=Claviceps pusilla TaxID=123648 RepID=A0A9P7SZI6_9HYPO|nr:hypothetical protein E4U43_003134 [Claviceps pusilla]
MALFVDSLFLCPATDASSTPASSGSTPPTTVGDSESQHSDASKLDVITVAPDDAIYVASTEFQEPTLPQSSPSHRPRRARASEPVYNLSKLSGTADHGKRRAKGDHVANCRRRTISGDTLVSSIEVVGADETRSEPRDETLAAGMNASDLQWSSASLRTPHTSQQTHASSRPQRTSSRLAGVSSIAATLTNMTHKGRETVNYGVTHLSRELRRLQDTNEFSGVDDRPVIHTIWSNGKYVDPNAPPREPSRKKSVVKPKEEKKEEEKKNKEEEKKNKEEEKKNKEQEEEEEGEGEEGDDDDEAKEKKVKQDIKKKDKKKKDKDGKTGNMKSGKKEKTDKTQAEDEAESDADDKEPVVNTKQRRVKKYLDKGLYAGQDIPLDVFKGLSPTEKKKLATLPELKELNKTGRVNKVMPFPIYTGLRTLIAGRDFKLPFNVCHPMPPGQPKPDEWKKMTKNRFIGDSKDYWRKTDYLHDLSKCVCKPEDGCGDNCQNRIMLYECDNGNCNVGKALCTNRSFADLASRRAKGGKYRIGVEVIKTSDRGYGVRSNRCFQPNQIIMEYTGEIITEVECERRMNEEYKNNECYYLMSFDQHMIIDATTGSIARFVNHSCNPNCRMIKWIVSGQPRMALFAGDRPIMTGDELTYDYNFDPFSKNVQKCLCGEDNCRGVLGPRPRDVKSAKVELNKTIKATVKAGKRKLKELIGADAYEFDEDDDDDDKNKNKTNNKNNKNADNSNKKTKKRKISPTTGLKKSLSTASLKAAKGAASALKKSVSSIGLKSKKKTATRTTKSTAAAHHRVSTGGAIKKTKTTTTTTSKIKRTKLLKKQKKKALGDGIAQMSSRDSSSMTIVAAVADGTTEPGNKGKGKASPTSSKRTISVSTDVSLQRPSLESRRRIIKPTPKAKANASL